MSSAPDRIRFHLDEHIDPAIADALRHHGIDVTTTVQAGLRTMNDGAQLAFVRSHHRVMVSSDTDFLRVAGSNSDHPGIVFVSSSSGSLGDVIKGLVLIYEVLLPDEMEGHVEFL
jgi:predicted nuclease of predicted toxin-antitoxin system